MSVLPYLYRIAAGAILGIVQGISEWLPISSKTQILLAASFLLHISFAQGYALGLFLEIGTFIAAVIYFRGELLKAILALLGKGGADGTQLLKYLTVTTLITAAIAVPLYLLVSDLVKGPITGAPMIVLGALLLADYLVITASRSRPRLRRDIKSMGLVDFALVGVAQGISALPGVSRSGATVSAMLFMGVKPAEAFRLSFIAGVIAALGATGVTLIFSHGSVGYVVGKLSIYGIIAAIAVSAAISIFLIGALIRFAGTSKIRTLLLALALIAIASGIVAMLTGVG